MEWKDERMEESKQNDGVRLRRVLSVVCLACRVVCVGKKKKASGLQKTKASCLHIPLDLSSTVPFSSLM